MLEENGDAFAARETKVIKKRGVKTGIGVVAVLIVAVALIGFRLYQDKLTVSLPDYAPIKKAVWLDQGWDQNQREEVPPMCRPGHAHSQHSL